MKTPFKIVLSVIVIAGGLDAFYYWKNLHTPPKAEIPTSPVATAPVDASTSASPESAIRYPLPKDLGPKNGLTLPSLNDSDLSFEESLKSLFGKTQIESIFKLQDLIRHIVVLMGNAKEKTFSLDLSPLLPKGDAFLVTQNNGKLWIDPKNDGRYNLYTNAIEGMDLKKFTDLYFQFYPLFQTAYLEINPKGYFNDRVIEVIDHLLSTPEAHTPIEVVAFNQSYHYADPSLEGLSVSQKALLRLGSEKGLMAKEKLRKLRNLLILGQ